LTANRRTSSAGADVRRRSRLDQPTTRADWNQEAHYVRLLIESEDVTGDTGRAVDSDVYDTSAVVDRVHHIGTDRAHVFDGDSPNFDERGVQSATVGRCRHTSVQQGRSRNLGGA